MNFAIFSKEANPQPGNGWLTIAVLRCNGATVKALAGLESANSRDVITYLTYNVYQDVNKDYGKCYMTSNMPFVLRTSNIRRINEMESVAIWYKGFGCCSSIKIIGDVTHYYSN